MTLFPTLVFGMVKIFTDMKVSYIDVYLNYKQYMFRLTLFSILLFDIVITFTEM